MEHECEYNGHKYWVTIAPTIDTRTNQQVFSVYVSDVKPNGMVYGSLLKDGNGNPMLFGDMFSALTNAKHMKQDALNRKPKS